MEFHRSAGVFAPDGRHPGPVDRVVVDPKTRREAHLLAGLKTPANIPERRPK
jgi:hypothetical protein